jgi:glycosyltransferase involved in cell wall biosynthesis
MPLTILQYITPSRLAGAEYFFLRVVAHLASHGHRVIVVTKRDTPLRAEIEKLLPLGVELHAWHTHGKIDPSTLIKLCALIRREKVDIINTHLTTASWQGAIAGKLTGVPSVAVVHATDRKTWFQHADKLIAVSGGVKQSLVEQCVCPDKIEVLYHGIDLGKYVAPLSTMEAKIRLGLSPDARVVGVAASLIPRKGHRFLLEALAQIEPRVGPIELLLAGEGELETELREQARELGLESRVHFLGFRRDVPEVLCALDVFVLPSLKEGLSIAVMEAMALEKPVIVSDIAGLPEVVREGETGFLVPPGDVSALAGALETVFREPERASELGRAARSFLEANFDQTRCLDAMESYFVRVANEPTRTEVQASAPRAFAAPNVEDSFVDEAVVDESESAPLRVVQLIAPSKIAGAERSTVSLSRGLGARGHKVWLLVKFGHALLETARAEGIDAASMRFGGKLNLFAIGRLVKWIRRRDIDIVATQLSTASLWGTLAARLLGVPSVATVRALNSKTCYVYADRIIVVSQAVKEHLEKQGIDPKRIRVVYNGIDLERFTPRIDFSAKTAVGIPADSIVVGVVAHLSEKKGHRWFLQAAAPVLREIPDAHILLVGDGPLRASLESFVDTLGMSERVHFAGFHPDIVPWMAAMDVLVLPTIAKEGFGRVLVEAGAMEKPVIGTDVGGISEVIVPGETGFVVAPRDETAMQNALRALLTDAELRAQMGRAGRERALIRFSAARMVENTERVYRELLREKKTPHASRVKDAVERKLV